MTAKHLITELVIKRLSVLTFFVLATHVLYAQDGISINATGAVSDASAILDVSSTSSGLLTPRMTEAEKNAIASPANGLTIFQTDGGVGFWFYDAIPAEWVQLQSYSGGTVDMGPAPSTIVAGSGYAVNRLGVGLDEITFNTGISGPPNVMLANSEAPGSPFNISEYCSPELNTCGCIEISIFEVYGGPGATNPIILNTLSGCTSNPDAYEFYPAGHPVYQLSGDADICTGDASNVIFRYRGNLDASPCNASRFYIWVDWQQDGFFDALGDLVVNTASVPWNFGGTQQATVPIPGTAFNGDTYVRAMVIEDVPNNSCPTVTAGETEDYQIYISCGTPAVYDNEQSYCNPGDISPTGFRVSCRLLGSDPVNVHGYHFQTNTD